MATKRNLTNYERGFLARTAEARGKRNLSQEAVAELLKIKQDRYKNYETRTLLPHEFVVPFCRITGTDPWELFAKSKPTIVALPPASQEGGNARKASSHPRQGLRKAGS